MPKAPAPVTSAPSLPYQPWDATSEEAVDKWVPVKEAGAASMSDGSISGGWPDNGSSSDGGWKQT